MKIERSKLLRIGIFGGLFLAIAIFSFRLKMRAAPPPESSSKETVLTEALRFSKNIFPASNLNALSVKIANKMMKEKEYAAARKIFEEILLSEPTNASILNNLAFISGEEGQLEKAAEYLRTAIQISGDCAECLNNLGSILYRQGKADEAKPLFEKAANLDPKYFDPSLNLAVLYEEAGDWSNAFEWYRKAEGKAVEPELKKAIQNRTNWMAEITQNLRRNLAQEPR